MKSPTLRWLYVVPGRKKLYIAALMLLQMIVGVSGVMEALFLKNVVDSAAARQSEAFWHGLLLLVLLMAARNLLNAAIRSLNATALSTLENAFKERLMSMLLRKDYATVSALHSGEWLNRLTSDTVVVAEGYVNILPGLTGMLVKLFSALILMISLDARFASILIPGGALVLVLTYVFRKRMKRLHKAVQEADGRLRVFLQERLGSMLMIRSFAAESQTEQEAGTWMEEHKSARQRKYRFANLCNIGFGAGMDGMYLFGLGYCGYGILTGSVSYGTLMAMIQLIGQIQAPFASLTGVLPVYYAMLASGERLMEIEEYPDAGKLPALGMDEVLDYYDHRMTGFGLRDAVFAYDPTVEKLADLSGEKLPPVLEHVSLEVKKGDMIALCGPSGCGKSTVLRLLMGVYRLDAGMSFLENMDGSCQEMTEQWRRLFAYVPQGNLLMHGSVRDVVSFGAPQERTDDAGIRRALEAACADFVDELEQGMDTMLGEHGTGLSEGQMQRLAIARAVFSRSPVLLLDEATSALDEKTEKEVLDHLRKLQNRTVVIVTHRPAALSICGRVIRFGEHGITEDGRTTDRA